MCAHKSRAESHQEQKRTKEFSPGLSWEILNVSRYVSACLWKPPLVSLLMLLQLGFYKKDVVGSWCGVYWDWERGFGHNLQQTCVSVCETMLTSTANSMKVGGCGGVQFLPVFKLICFCAVDQKTTMKFQAFFFLLLLTCMCLSLAQGMYSTMTTDKMSSECTPLCSFFNSSLICLCLNLNLNLTIYIYIYIILVIHICLQLYSYNHCLV